MGVCSSRLDDDNAAIQYYFKAIELADGEDDEDVIKFEANYKLAIISSLQQEYNNAIKYYLLALEYVGDDLMLKADCYRHIAFEYSDILNPNRDFTKAYEYYGKVDKIYNSISNIDPFIKADLYSTIARCCRSNLSTIPGQNYYKAIEYYDKAINIYNSEIKKRGGKLDEKVIRDYIDSYGFKATSLEMLEKYEDAIEVRNVEKELLKQYDSQITDRQWYDLAIKVVNSSFSRCYKKLNE